AEKSEVLSEDQQENEKRVEQVKHAFQNISKKAAATLQSTGTDFDKRLKKLPESGLSCALIDSAQMLTAESLLSTVCKICGECQSNIAAEQVQYEMKVENDFINPLQTICEVDIPSIIKLRKALNKSTLDMDSAKSRFNQAVRQSQVPGANMSTAAAKAENIREEYDEASLKVETIKDNLSIELCNFAAKESEQSQKMLILLEAQAEYHRKALQAIEQFIPLVKIKIDNSPCKPVFGMPLEEHLRLMKRDISLVIEACVTLLLECGLEEEGLFRIAGAAMKLKKLKACFDAQTLDMEEFSNDPHTVAVQIIQTLYCSFQHRILLIISINVHVQMNDIISLSLNIFVIKT
ncbi:Rho GTPase-activating protein 44, partial [Bulinus truncatus]